MPRSDSKVLSLPILSNDQWREDPETGEWVPSAKVRRFLEWFMDMDRPAGESMSKWARDNNLQVQTVSKWFNDSRFRDLLNARCEELNLRPDRTQRVIEVVWKKAIAGDIKAAQLYLQHVGKLAPVRSQVEVTVTHKVTELSDAQLQAEVARVMKALPAGVIDVEVPDAVQERQATPVHAHEASRDRQQVGEGSKGERD